MTRGPQSGLHSALSALHLRAELLIHSRANNLALAELTLLDTYGEGRTDRTSPSHSATCGSTTFVS
jgi:hypothetical protein